MDPDILYEHTDAGSCDVCSAEDAFAPDVRVSVAGRFPAEICACGHCGFRQIRPRPTPAALAACYDEGYFLSDDPGNLNQYLRQRHRHHRQAFFLARRLQRWRPGGRLLEVGCALGFLLEGLCKQLDWQVEGLDISPFATHFAAAKLGLDVHAATLEDAAYPDASFDFIVQKDLVEHVSWPREHLLETRRVLRPGGRTWLIVPHGEAHLRPLRRLAAGRTPEQIEKGLLPLLTQAHVSFFWRANLLQLFDACGFRVLSLRSVGIKRGWRLLGYLPAKRMPPLVPGLPPEGQTAAADVTAGQLEEHAQRLHEELARSNHPTGNRLYDHWRRIMSKLDTLPARIPWGVDFECLVERRD